MRINIQRFAEDEEVEETETTEVEETPVEEKETKQSETKKSDKSFVKIREEKARENLLKELGVKNVDEAKEKIEAGSKALDEIEKIKKQLEDRDKASIYAEKVNKLTKILDDEKVFDSDALIGYIDFDNVELDAYGNIKDSQTIIEQLKEYKPNFFGKEFIKTDTYKKGTEEKQTVDPYKDNYDKHNYVGVISTYLKNNKK